MVQIVYSTIPWWLRTYSLSKADAYYPLFTSWLFHHPRLKHATVKTLADQALHICEPQYLGEGLGHLDGVLQSNCYYTTEIGRAMQLHTSSRIDASEEYHDVLALCQQCNYVGKLSDMGVGCVKFCQHRRSNSAYNQWSTSGYTCGIYRAPSSY